MLLRFPCPQCNHEIELDAARANYSLSCPECHGVVTPPPPAIGPGVTLGNFRIERRLGHGAMGDVFLAVQLSMDRQVALKVLPQSMTREARTIERFRREVRMSARLEHPNIITAFEAGEDFGHHFLAMTYVDGEDLSTRVKREGALDEREALGACRQVADALRYAWEEHRMLHRDVKPSNIMVEPGGRARLMDLGISVCLEEAHTTLTAEGMAVGTPHYMSPEQIRAQELDWRADAYSLGATLYHLVTGGTPFKGTGSVEVISQQLNEMPVPVRERRASLSAGISDLIDRMMAKDRELRQRSWDDLLRDMDLVLAGKRPPLPPTANRPQRVATVPARPVPAPAAKPTPPPPSGEERLPPVVEFRPRRERPRHALLSVFVLLVLAGILCYVVWRYWLVPRHGVGGAASDAAAEAGSSEVATTEAGVSR